MIKNKDDLKRILFTCVSGISCYLIAFLITHLLGIEHIQLKTISYGYVSSTTAIFFALVLIPLLYVVVKYFKEEEN